MRTHAKMLSRKIILIVLMMFLLNTIGVFSIKQGDYCDIKTFRMTKLQCEGDILFECQHDALGNWTLGFFGDQEKWHIKEDCTPHACRNKACLKGPCADDKDCASGYKCERNQNSGLGYCVNPKKTTTPTPTTAKPASSDPIVGKNCNSKTDKKQICSEDETKEIKCDNNKWTVVGCNEGFKCLDKKCLKTCTENSHCLKGYKCDEPNCIKIAADPAKTKDLKPCKPYSKVSNCKCGETDIGKTEKYCCDGKVKTEECKIAECPKDKVITFANFYKKACMCYGEKIKQGVCCTGRDVKLNHKATTAEECKDKGNICKQNCDEKASFPCVCPEYCSKEGKIEKGGTCGEVKPKETCMPYRECKTKCDEGQNNYKAGDMYCKVKDGKSSVCCEKTDGKKTDITRCNEICRDPDGCVCNEKCIKDNNGKQVAVGNIEAGQNCQGGFGNSNPCSGPKRETRDFRCPQGCFWFNDFDCAPDKNMGNILWDYVAKKEWKDYYQEKWVKKIEAIGAYFDPDNWAKSYCNKVSPYYGRKDTAENLITSDNRPVGWIGANSQPHGEDKAIYTISWFVQDLEENNTFNITAITPNGLKKILDTVNISRGAKEEDTFAFVNQTLFNDICIEFKKEVCYVKATIVGTKQCKTNICRKIK